MKTAIYIRVSSGDQDATNQLPSMLEYAKSRGYEVISIFEEQGSAWKAGHQPALAGLLEAVRSGRRKYDILLVWALDRLSRQGASAILQLIDTFKAYGMRVVSYQENWTESPGAIGEILYAIVGWVAQMESQRRSERTKAGQARVRRDGTKTGRGIGQRGRDRRPRQKAGYLLRYLKDTNKRPVSVTPDNSVVESNLNK